MGWTNPAVIGAIVGGAALLVAFVLIERRVAEPMFQLGLFRIRAFAAGSAAGLIAAAARGGLQFMLIIWLQGIWLPLHGYNYTETPLWAGIYLLPLTAAFLISGPISGYLSDRFGARGFATAGMLVFARELRRPDAAPRRLSLLGVRVPDHAERDRRGDVQRPQLGLDHEQRPGPPARRRLRDAVDFPEHRHGAFDRGVLLAADRRPGDQPSSAVAPRPAAAGRLARDRPPGRRPAAGVVAVRRGARREPGRAPAGADRRAVVALRRAPARPDRHAVLPEADRRRRSTTAWWSCSASPPACPARRARVAAARRPLRPRRDAPPEKGTPHDRPDRPATRGAARDGLSERGRRHVRRS